MQENDFQITHYNCCDLLKWQIIARNRIELFKDLSRPFWHFETQDFGHPDIKLILEPNDPDKEYAVHLVDHKYFIGPNYLYCSEKYPGGSFSVEIRGLNENETIIRFHGTSNPLARVIAPLALVHHSILRPVIMYKLARRGSSLLHAAGICRDGQAIVFAGRGGTFKTSILMDSVRHEGFKALGDDAVILSKGQAYPFPTSPNLLRFRMKHLEDESLKGLRDRVAALIFLLKNRDSNTLRQADTFMSSPVPLRAVVLVNRKHMASKVEMKQIDQEDAVAQLVANNFLETRADTVYILGKSPPVFGNFLDAYALVYPDAPAATFWRDFSTELNHSLADIPCYEMVLPALYTDEVFFQVNNMLDRM